MEYKNQTYYWVLPLNEERWMLAKHIEGGWVLTDGRFMLTNHLGQTGEEILSNDELLKKNRMYVEAMDTLLTFVRESKSDNKLAIKAVELLNRNKE